MILLDTNILIRYAQPTDSAHPVATAAVTALQAAGETLCLVPQNLYEFWTTATRPLSANGLGLTVQRCQIETAGLRRVFHFLPDQPTLFAEWESLVVQYQCHGRVSFDARLVAAMRTHSLTRLLTFNTADFTRYPGLTVLDPHAVIPTP